MDEQNIELRGPDPQVGPNGEELYVNAFGEVAVSRKPKWPSVGKDTLHFTMARDIPKEDIEWLWKPYIPLGKLMMLDGDPGVGKSTMSAWLAAAVSTGQTLPDQDAKPARSPSNVLMLSAEDGISDTIKQRLLLMGADLTKVFVSDDALTLNPKGLAKLERTIVAIKPTLVFLDPIVFYMGGDMDMNRANEVRAMTGALSMMAVRHTATIVLVRHLRKQGANNSIYRGQGSIDFVGASRSTLLLDRWSSGKTVMEHIKSNVGPKGTALEYHVSENGSFQWGGPVVAKAVGKVNKTPKPTVIGKAKEFLKDFLKDGPRPYVDIAAAADLIGVNDRALERAKPGLAFSHKGSKIWTWELVPEVVQPSLPMEPTSTAKPSLPLEEALRRFKENNVKSEPGNVRTAE